MERDQKLGHPPTWSACGELYQITFFVGGNADEMIDDDVFVAVVEAFTAITSIFAESDLAHATTSAWSFFGEARGNYSYVPSAAWLWIVKASDALTLRMCGLARQILSKMNVIDGRNKSCASELQLFAIMRKHWIGDHLLHRDREVTIKAVHQVCLNRCPFKNRTKGCQVA